MNDDCQFVHAFAEDLALGVLTGEERAAALDHLEECHACRAEIATLTDVADAVLLLAPAAAPDVAFERRVLDRLASAQGNDRTRDSGPPAAVTSRRQRRMRSILAAAAVVAVLVVASLLWAGRSQHAVAAAMIDGRGGGVGRVALVADHGTAVQMDLPGWPDLVRRYGDPSGGSYWLELALDDGSRLRTPLPPGDNGNWRVSTPVDRSHVLSVSITDPDGHSWCHAQFD